MRVINDRRQNFLLSLVLSAIGLSNFKKRKKFNWYANSIIFYIVWITIVNKSCENKITFQEYWMTFPYLQMPHFLDWLSAFFWLSVFKGVVQKWNYFRKFFCISKDVFRLEIPFAKGIKNCACTRAKGSFVWSKIFLSGKRPYNILVIQLLHYKYYTEILHWNTVKFRLYTPSI